MQALRILIGRPRAGAGLIAGLALLALALIPLPVAGSLAVRSLQQQLSQRTGLTVIAEPGDVRISLLPFPKATLRRITIADSSGRQLARIGALDAYLRPLDLVGGRLRFSGYAAADAVINAADDPARASWRAAGHALVDAATRPPGPIPAELSLDRAIVATGAAPLTDVQATLSWGGASSPLSAWGRARWKNEEAQIRLSGLLPDAFMDQAGRSPLRLDADGPFGKLAFSGEVSGPVDWRGEGDLRLQVASVERLGRWLDFAPPLAGLIDRYGLNGRVAISARGLTSAAATVNAGGSEFEGTLGVRLDGERPQISGTLAAQTIDFDALGGAVDAMREPAGAWSRDAFDPTPLRRTDVDLRLSANKVLLFGARLDDTAISISLNAGRLEFALGRAQAYRGALRGRATVQALDGDRVETRLQGSFEEIDLGAASQDVLGRRPLSGRAQGHILIEASGRTPADLAQQAAGKALLQMKDGDVAGFNLAEALRRPDRVSADSNTPARTAFSTLELGATIAQGAADIVDATLGAANGVTAIASGQAFMRDQSVRIDGAVRAPALPAGALRFKLTGPWLQPALKWEFATPFKRS